MFSHFEAIDNRLDYIPNNESLQLAKNCVLEQNVSVVFQH
jgi:hypothetical protein